ncbi:MAG: KH domain-containing protein [Chloroflexi bacterium]|nr:KH domain-containing protein [Chloroflexota bacterium]MCH8008963.1 KH domain-containing protein [Chloroflexota bacterium]MCH8161906.1 KH domain-containing protein [Chloroflexota bacterium]
MKELVEFIAKAIVDHPDDVEVEVEEYEEDGDRVILHLYVADDDMGKVIGKQGRIANAMRDLVKVAAVQRGVRASLDIGD